MRLTVDRKPVYVNPDPRRVIARYFFYGEERALFVIKNVLAMDEQQIKSLIYPLLQDFSRRHRNITDKLMKHCLRVRHYIESCGGIFDELDDNIKYLIGAYFTHEYSIESAAFFNPSIVPDPDQLNLEEGQMRVIMSFRAVGEGHISSIVFRRGMVDRFNNINIMPAGNFVDEAEKIHETMYHKKLFLKKGAESGINTDFLNKVDQNLDERFDYQSLKTLVLEEQSRTDDDNLIKE